MDGGILAHAVLSMGLQRVDTTEWLNKAEIKYHLCIAEELSIKQFLQRLI